MTVKVIANETSTEVVQSLYPDQSVWTGVSLNSIQIEWDPSYVEDLAKCWKKFRDIRGRSFRRDYWNYLRQFLCRNHEYIWRSEIHGIRTNLAAIVKYVSVSR